MSNSHEIPDLKPLPAEKPSRLLWWLHPKVALPLLLLGSLLLSPFLYRGYRISAVPHINNPFDVEAFASVDIAPEENAMTQYASAALLHHPFPYFGGLDEALTHGWSHASAYDRKWLDDNQPALAEWRKGTERSQAVLIQPKDFRFQYDSPLEEFAAAHSFIFLARYQAEKCISEGDFEAAWGWLLAAVRASRHLEQNGSIIQRRFGVYCFINVSDGINRWAAQPAVTADLLRKAQVEFREADQLTPANSVAIKAEYVAIQNVLKDSGSLQELLTAEGFLNEDGEDAWKFRSSSLYVIGEPELSWRVIQHAFKNWLSEIDKPVRDRAPFASGNLRLYDLPFSTPPSMSPQELERILPSTLLAQSMLRAFEQADIAMQCEAAKRAAVSAMLACQRYHHLHGDWPATLTDLVPNILDEPPTDPLEKTGELLLMKRDGDDLVIYSVGPDGRDDGGAINETRTHNPENPNDDFDQGLRLKRPLHHEKSANPDITPQEKN